MTSVQHSIEVQNQVLEASVPLVGTEFELRYRSDRVPGYRAPASVTIPLSDATVPESLERIDLEMSIANQRIEETFGPEPNQTYEFTWDGRDGFGRPVQGSRTLSGKLGYTYDGVYFDPDDRFRSFGTRSGTRITGSRTREEVTLWQDFELQLTTWVNEGQTLGGWGLDVHHRYDPFRKVLHLGTGQQRDGESIGSEIVTIAGKNRTFGDDDELRDGRPAREVQLPGVTDVVTTSDGGYYISDLFDNRIYRVDSDGLISVFAGTGERDSTGNGRPATEAQLSWPKKLAVGPDGSVYVSESNSPAFVRRIGPDGIIDIFAGGGTSSRDGVPAREARLGGFGGNITGLDVDDDGVVYIAGDGRIRTVGSDGLIFTVAGGGDETRDGVPATEARLIVDDVLVSRDGSLLVPGYADDVDDYRIYRVTTSGTLETVVGGGTEPLSSGVDVRSVALPRLGSFNDGASLVENARGELYFIAERQVYRVTTSGTITLEAGTGAFGIDRTDRGLPSEATMQPEGLAIDPDDGLLIADGLNDKIRRVTVSLPGFSAGGVLLPSAQARLLYVFDDTGRHVETRNALTGRTVYTFEYSQGLLDRIVDEAGNVTSVRRGESGGATEIISPSGRSTLVTSSPNGYVSSLVEPSGAATLFGYDGGGSLTEIVHADGTAEQFSYDDTGLLVSHTDRRDKQTDLTRSPTEDGFRVTVLSPELRETTHLVERTPSGETRRRNTCCGGDGIAVLETPLSRFVRYPDGTETQLTVQSELRFGLQVPLVRSYTVETPGGLSSNTTVEQRLEPPLAGMLDFDEILVSIETNERVHTRTFDRNTLTSTDTTAEGRALSIRLDEKGRVVEAIPSGLAGTTIAYDEKGRVFSVTAVGADESRTTSFEYTEDDLLESVTSPIGEVMRFEYDDARNLTVLRYPDGRVVSHDHDISGNIVSLTPPEKPPHQFGYDLAENLTSYTPPVGEGPAGITYQYDDDGAVTRIAFRDGRDATMDYDSARRLQTVETDRGTVEYEYDTTTGLLTGVVSPDAVSIRYEYDGSLLVGTRWEGTIEGSVAYEYDRNLLLRSHGVGNRSIAYEYDDDGLITKAGELTLNRRSDNGLLAESSIRTVRDFWGYNDFGEPVTYRVEVAGNSLYDAQYRLDPLGRAIECIEQFGDETTTYEYEYDSAGRLSSVDRDGVTTTYSYEQNGNVIETTGPQGPVTAVYDDRDRLLQYAGTAYAYDSTGALRERAGGDGTTAYEYDVFGNLTTVTLPTGRTIEYLLDGFNRRVGKIVDGEFAGGLLYKNSLQPIAEVDATGAIQSHFVYASRSSTPDYLVRGNATYRIISDRLGSPRLVIDVDTGVVQQRIDYDAFGAVLTDTNPGFQPFGFAGGLFDPDTGLLRFGARDYDPETGRWTAADPTGFADGANLYAYAKNDPVNLVDPAGTNVLAPAAPLLCGVGAVACAAAVLGAAATLGLIIYLQSRINPSSGSQNNPQKRQKSQNKNKQKRQQKQQQKQQQKNKQKEEPTEKTPEEIETELERLNREKEQIERELNKDNDPFGLDTLGSALPPVDGLGSHPRDGAVPDSPEDRPTGPWLPGFPFPNSGSTC